MLVEEDELSTVSLVHYVAGDSESSLQTLEELDACKSSLVSNDSPLVSPDLWCTQAKDYNKIAGSWAFMMGQILEMR